MACDWTFKLHPERRNQGFASKYDLFSKKDGWDKKNEIDGKYYLVTQEAGTVFSTNRLYVKQGQKDFESITLLAQNGNKKGRFWVKLEDINNAIIMPWK